MSSLLNHFGLRQLGRYDSSLAQMYRQELADTIATNGMAALIGSCGAGKTHLIGEIESQLAGEVKFVSLVDFSAQNIKMGSILENLVLGLSDQSPRRSAAARSHQVIRILGETFVSGGTRVCLVIDDAHRLPPATLSAIKILRERDFAGRRPLLSVILLGWPELGAMLERRKDLLWRTEILRLTDQDGWMTLKERVSYLEAVFGPAIEEETRLRIASTCLVPEHMNTHVLAAMRQARRLGLRIVDQQVVQPPPADLKEKLGLSISTIAKEAGISSSSVHRALNDHESPYRETVQAAIQRIGQRKAEAA